ncbi:hypothetical protein A2635_03905 [Candidatus Peribacteria bacterium RIFCSPHIGHO2_01_FULL_51_9]|nr:MAG: hypothetical protein A2635_03905 [Candidatus Peribacteria bacterium RIFCSPHIGHO2_01_FULL_51_9]
MDLFLATSNRGKVIEICDVLADLPCVITTPAHLSHTFAPPEETGLTCQENALIKARFYYKRTGLPTLADDSGLIVEALKDELGLHTRRWGAGPQASDEEWVAYFLNRMKEESNRTAIFTCTLAYINQTGAEYLFEGRCTGTITQSLEADYLPGLPISACFKPEGYAKVFSALSKDEKNQISHRGKAVQHFKLFLEKYQ